MKVAILSDIHSNKYALAKVLETLMADHEIKHYIILGDFFGYYPWAQEVYDLVMSIPGEVFCISGNHDELMARPFSPDSQPEYWDVLKQNWDSLTDEAKMWISGLKPKLEIVIDNVEFKLYHGTPDDPLYGRFYPDYSGHIDWFPSDDEVILLGHTHYPLFIRTEKNGLIINPGSVGQPRDLNLDSSFCVFDTILRSVEHKRISYDVSQTIEELKRMNWYPRAIKSLEKTK